jgi:hypothetical protein
MNVADVGDTKLDHPALPLDNAGPQGIDVLPLRSWRERIDCATYFGTRASAKATGDNALLWACLIEQYGVFQAIAPDHRPESDRLAFRGLRVTDDVAQVPLTACVGSDGPARRQRKQRKEKRGCDAWTGHQGVPVSFCISAKVRS